MTKFVTLTFTRDELAEALCATSLLALWDERADRIIEILTTKAACEYINCHGDAERRVKGVPLCGFHADEYEEFLEA